MIQKRCRTCIYAKIGHHIECRRNAPRPQQPDKGKLYIAWPIMQYDDFCGEWTNMLTEGMPLMLPAPAAPGASE